MPTEPDASESDPTTTTLALTGGTNDADTATANAVVRVGGGCTGILITPLIALTARHCISGSIRKPFPMGRTPTIRVGAVAGAWRDHRTIGTALWGETMPSNSSDPGPLLNEDTEYGRDLAAVFLDPEDPAYEVSMARPSTLTASFFGLVPELQAATWTVPAGWRLGYAGWSPTGGATNRQVAYPNLTTMFHGVHGGGATWSVNWVEPRVHPGDSGGPLFAERPDGRREPIGITFGTWTYRPGWIDELFGADANTTQHWVDLQHPPTRDWLATLARTYGARTVRWRAQHGTTADLWYGEADYLGACNASIDRDCDHWVDAHDNCVGVANPDQLDSDDNGRGDPCNNPQRAPSVHVTWSESTNTIHVQWSPDARRGETYRATSSVPYAGTSHVLFDGRVPATYEGGPPERTSFARPADATSSLSVSVCTVNWDGAEMCGSNTVFFTPDTSGPLPPPTCPRGFMHCPGVGCVRWGRCEFME